MDFLIQRFFYTAISALSLFYFIVKFSLSHWKKRGILHEKPKFLWGNLKGVGGKKHIAHVLDEIYAKYKGKAPFIGFYAYLKPMVLILDLDMLQQMLSKDALYFIERGLYHNASDDPLSFNLMQLDGEQWQQLRDNLKSTFAAEKIATIMPALVRVAATFQRSFEAQQRTQCIFDINELVECFNVDVIADLAFGLEGDSLLYANTEFRQMTRQYMQSFHLIKAYLAFDYPNLARLLQYKTYDQLTTSYFLKLVNDKVKEREWNRVPRQNDFLKMFAELRRLRNPKQRIDNKQIAAQAFSFILAGLEACNSTLTFCFYELALQPDIQNQARAEIEAVFKQHKGKFDYECLNDMQYLQQILKETLRKHSPYPFLLRNTVKDYEVPNSVFMLKRGNHAIIPITAIHHDSHIYPEPQKFDPNRFAASAVRARHPMSWLPFGMGPRNCIAQQFAELQMLVCLVTLLRQYKFNICSDTCKQLQYDNTKLLLKPKSDIKLCVERI